MRIVIGYDIHALVPGRKLVLGGITIPHPLGELAHSDGDVLIHALCDALLGAAGLGDIGTHFPDSDSQYKDISSLILLERCVSMIHERNFSVVNADAVILLQNPKIQGFIPEMKKKIALILQVDLSTVNIKATTAEKLGYIGREEGVAAEAVVLIS